MSAKRLYPRIHLLMLLLLIGCQQTGIGQDRPDLPVNDRVVESELDEQLKLAKDALYKGSTEQMRINAAAVLLSNEDPVARKILLEALKRTGNGAARAAVCKALSQAGAVQKPVEGKSDFIPPLLGILTADDFAGARLAAEATLLFEYEQISQGLEKIVADTSLPAKARLNAIYALKLQPDMRAAIELINLIGDPEGQVSAVAEETLKSLGISVGKGADAHRQTIDRLRREGQEAFLRNRLIHQEAQIRKLGTELDVLQQLYLAALSEYYDSISDDAADAKGEFLAERLRSSKKVVRLWALEMVSQSRRGTDPKLLGELGPILISLVSDQDRDVRLKTAELLSFMPELDSAKKLLEQHTIETYDDVKTEIFGALGEAVSYAFSPGSPVKIQPWVRKQTLDLASEYLSEQESAKAQKGAKVIEKLLEQDGLTSAEVGNYLGRLTQRYKQEQAKANGTLRGELLSAMAGLCGQSVYKAQAQKLFRPLFEEALGDETNLVREAAVGGLIYIDKARALKILRGFINDPSIVVRRKVIELIGEVGGKGDLALLAKKIGSAAESDLVWQVMVKIFKSSSCGAAVLDKWIGEFDSTSTKSKLSDEQMVSLLETAEGKAESENKPEILKRTRERLAGLYRKSGKFKQAAYYYGVLYQAEEDAGEKEAILANLLDVYLRWPNVEGAAQLMANYLLAKDLDPNSAVALSIDNYCSHPPAGADAGAVLAALKKVNIPEPRPVWQKQMKRWTDMLEQPENLNKPQETGN